MNAEEAFPKPCSYGLTGSSLASQAIYVCSTCSTSTSENQCCCSSCAEVCHAGHEVNYLAYGMAYCDCGQSSSCQLAHSSSTVPPKIIHPSAFHLHDASPVFQSYRIQLNSVLDVNLLQQQCQLLIQRTKDTFWVDLTTPPRYFTFQIKYSFQAYL